MHQKEDNPSFHLHKKWVRNSSCKALWRRIFLRFSLTFFRSQNPSKASRFMAILRILPRVGNFWSGTKSIHELSLYSEFRFFAICIWKRAAPAFICIKNEFEIRPVRLCHEKSNYAFFWNGTTKFRKFPILPFQNVKFASQN